jgi:hypothetical protein
MGIVHSYDILGSESEEKLDSAADDDEIQLEGADWAIIQIPRSYYLKNSFSLDSEEELVDGYLSNKELSYGEVRVCSGYSGTQKGILGGTVSVFMGRFEFEARSVALEAELGEQ